MGGGKKSKPPAPKTKYACPHCSTFVTEDETKLEAHKSIHFCSDCGQHFGDVTSHKAHCLGVEIPCDICHQQIARGQMAQHQQQTHKCPHCGDVVKHSPQRCPKVWCGTHSKAFPCKDCAKVNCPHCQAEQPNVAALQLHVQAEHTCQHCAGIFAANLDTHEQDCPQRHVQCKYCLVVLTAADLKTHEEAMHRCKNCKDLVPHPSDRCPVVFCSLHSCMKPCTDCDYPVPAFLKPYRNQPGQHMCFNVCIAGRTSVGKSSLLNEFCGEDAPCGYGQTTMEVKAYKLNIEKSGYVAAFLEKASRLHTSCIRENLRHTKVFDLPGHGTKEFPPGRYIAEMGLRYFDYVVLAVSGPISEVDVELVTMLQNADPPVKCLVVQTKVDNLIMEEAFNKVIDMVESEEVSEADAKGLREKLALEAMAGLRQESAKCFGSTTVPIYLVGCAKKLICKLSPYKQELLELVETGAFFDKLILDIIEARAGHRLHHSFEHPLRKVRDEQRRATLINYLLGRADQASDGTTAASSDENSESS